MATRDNPGGNGSISIVDMVVQGLAINASGTITTGGASQQLLAANVNRRGFTVQNQSSGDLYIRVGATATVTNSSLRIAPGVLYETPAHHVSTNVVNIIGATNGQAFYATEF